MEKPLAARSGGCMRGLSLLAVLAVLACQGEPAEPEPAVRLRKLAVDPAALPAACHLTWSARPVAMSPKKDAKLLTMMARFWFGEDAPRPSDLRGALSNVYAPPDDPKDGPLVLMVFDFEREQDALAREEQLARMYKATDEYRVHRQGSLVVAMGFRPPVDEPCATGAWKQTLALLAAH